MLATSSHNLSLMGFFSFLSASSGGINDRKVATVRRKFWSQAKSEAARFSRNEVWYADVLGVCLADLEVTAALDAVGWPTATFKKKVAEFQSPQERSDEAARSGAFIVTENEFSWPLDRAVDRAVATRRRQSAKTVRALDVFLGAISPGEQDLAKHLVDDNHALHFRLAWEVSHPGAAQEAEPPRSGKGHLVFHADPFTTDDFLKQQLSLVPELDQEDKEKVVAALKVARSVAVGNEDNVSLLAGIRDHVLRERVLAGYPLRVEVNAGVV